MINRKIQKRIIIFLWIAFFLSISSVFTLFVLVKKEYFGPLPSIEQIQNPNTNLATQVISADGQNLGTFFKENRSPAQYNEIPKHLIHALVATEDVRFFEHSGIDFKSLARAIMSFGSKGGASTLTQQLAKMLFTERPSSNPLDRIRQKILEWVIAIELENLYSKEEIITMYLNKFDFLYQAVGIKSAADIYFGKKIGELTIEEASLLVGMAKNPSLYNPRRYPTLALDRRNTVLQQMYKSKYLEIDQLDSIRVIPINLEFKRKGHTHGIATYFREYIRLSAQKILRKINRQTGSTHNLYRDGLKIYTTIDSRMQKNAEYAVKAHMSNLQNLFFQKQEKNPTAPFRNLTQQQIDTLLYNELRKTGLYSNLQTKFEDNPVPVDSLLDLAKNTIRDMTIFSWEGNKDTTMSVFDSLIYYKSLLHTGMMAMDPNNGHVKAWIGGIDNTYFKYDHVYKGARQVGSLFKPFVYSTAVERLKISPCQKFPNTHILFKKEEWGLDEDWMPRNANNNYGGELTVKEGLAKSVNTITASLMKKIGPHPVVQKVKKMGVKSYIPASPSICLGTADLTVKEVVGAFATFANKGVYTEPVTITRIEDKNNVTIYQPLPKTEEVMDEESAYVTLKLMEEVVNIGTAQRLANNRSGGYWQNPVTEYPYNLRNPIAAKTGTTQNHSDGWFMGIVPNLVAGVWVGADERSVNFENIYFGQGATMALPIWAIFMKKNYEDPAINVSKAPFKKPRRMSIRLNCDENIGTNSTSTSNDNTSLDDYDF